MVLTRNVQDFNFIGDKMQITVDKRIYLIDLSSVSEKLLLATDNQRKLFKISPAGYGIHWPLIDEDLSVEKLIQGATDK